MKSYKIKLILVGLSFTLFGLGCKTSKYVKDQKEMFKSIYISQFKLTYLRLLLKKSYNNSESINQIIRSDKSGFSEVILTESDFQFIDSLANSHNETLIIDSIQGKQRAQGSQGKRPLGFLINKFESNYIDSSARKRLKLAGVPKSWTVE